MEIDGETVMDLSYTEAETMKIDRSCSEILKPHRRRRRMMYIVEDFDLREEDEEPLMKRTRLEQTREEIAVKGKLDSHRIRTIRECLHGIPPPPSLTNPRISIEEVVEKLSGYFDHTADLSAVNGDAINAAAVHPEKINLDVYYNDNLKCETLDYLYEKVRQRYIMNETSSFVSTAPKFTIIESPLSCDFLDMLPRSMSSPASPVPDNLSVEIAQRRSRIRSSTSQKIQPVRRSPRKATMAIKNPNLRMNGLMAQRDAFLLQVPQKEMPKVGKPTTKFITVPNTKTASAAKDMPVKKTDEKHPKLDELSEFHQRKLIWATINALKATSPNLMEDSAFFKKCRTTLYRLCLVQWPKQEQVEGKGETKPAKGTSDRMLEMATLLAPQVVNSMTSS